MQNLKGEAKEPQKCEKKIDGLEYDIIKVDDEGIKIKVFEPKNNEIYYEYEASKSKLKEDIQILVYYEDLNEMISTIKRIFNEGKVQFLEENNKYYIELQFKIMGTSKKNKIELIKHDFISDLNKRINKIENDIKNINKEIEILKTNKIKEEILQDKDFKMKLYEEFEQMICSKYNINKEKNEENTNKKIEQLNNNMKIINDKINEI